MPETSTVSERFRGLRERAGLTREEAANRMRVSSFDIETTDLEWVNDRFEQAKQATEGN